MVTSLHRQAEELLYLFAWPLPVALDFKVLVAGATHAEHCLKTTASEDVGVVADVVRFCGPVAAQATPSPVPGEHLPSNLSPHLRSQVLRIAGVSELT